MAARRRKTRRRRPARRPWRRWLALIVAVFAAVVGGYVLWLDYRVTSTFDGKRWALPARVFARPLELFPGRRITPGGLVRELEAAGYRAVSPPDEPGEYDRDGARFRLNTRPFRFPDGREPARRLGLRIDGDRVTALTARGSGESVALARLDPAHIGNIHPGRNEDRDLVRLDEVPRTLVEALIAVEDRGFASHFGVSPLGIARAAIANLRAGEVVQGGSTLTQQLVKNLYLSRERSLWRKANEAIMAVLLELHYDKGAILEAYLNEVYLGQDGARAIHGVGLAARFYFGEPLGNLDLAEQALLVGLVKGPSYYNPRRHPERARARRRLVLDAMVETGFIEPARARTVAGQPLGVTAAGSPVNTPHPAFMDLVRRHLARDYRDSDLTSEGLRVFTTLAPEVQGAAEDALASRARAWSDAVEGAVISVNADNGEVEAVVGGRNPRYDGFNRALDARRPIGSLIKPAVYLTALARPSAYGLGTPVVDRPVTLQDARGQSWQPENYDGTYKGEMPLWLALAESRNAATVRLGLDLGLRAVVDTLDRLGGTVPETVYPSLLLGAVGQSPLDVARLYGTLAAGGFRMPLRSVRAVMTPGGDVLSRYELSVERAMDPAPVFLVNHALQRVVQQGTAEGLSRWLSPSLRVAGKTGTTDGLRDSWFAGFSGDRLAVVWVGRDDNGRTGLTGASGAMTVWGELFADVAVRPLETTPPEGVARVWIDPEGRLAAADCEQAVQLPYIRDHLPTRRAPCAEAAGDGAGDWLRGWFQ